MCDRTRKCPDYKLLPIQLEVVREMSNILPLSGAERNYREACIDLMLEINELIHDNPPEHATKGFLDFIDHLHMGLESIDQCGIARLPYGDPRHEAVRKLKQKHVEAVRALNPEYADRIEARNRQDEEAVEEKTHDAITSAMEKAALLPMTEDERAEHNGRTERLKEITRLVKTATDPGVGLRAVLETVGLVAEQAALEKTVAGRVKKGDPNYAKIRQFYFKGKP